MRRFAAALVCFIIGAAPLRGTAEDYRGAPEVIRVLGSPPAPPEAGNSAELRRDLASFSTRSTAMPPAQAAAEWLKLADRTLASQPDPAAAMRGGDGAEPVPFHEVVAALPPPAAWSALAGSIEQRESAKQPTGVPDRAWLILAHMLRGDPTAVWDDAAALGRDLKRLPGGRQMTNLYSVRQVLGELARQSGDPAQITRITETLAEMAAPGGGQVEVPDLVALVGRAKAEAMLRRMMLQTRAELSLSTGDETQKLARRIALAEIKRLRVPQWGLAQNLESADLYLALSLRFPAAPAVKRPGMPGMQRMAEQEDRGRLLARLYYMLGLVSRGRAAEAAQVAATLGSWREPYYFQHAFDALDQNGSGAAVLTFLRLALSRTPALPLWDAYVARAAGAGRPDEVVNLLREIGRRPKLNPSTRAELRGQLYKALISAGHVDDAVKCLREDLAASGPGTSRNGAAETGLKLAQLGQAAGRSEWLDDGLKLARAGVKSETYGSDAALRLAERLEEAGRRGEAEDVLIESLSKSGRGAVYRGNQIEYLVGLTGLYHRAGRPADVLTLAEGLSDWPARDLSELLSVSDWKDLSLGYMVAAALVDQGRPEKAVPILEELLRERGDYDPAYEVLIGVRKEASLPFLDELAARDRFEERPLIWKAVVLFRAHRLEEAERAAREAIAIDPSDGEQRFGRRMRVYAVLADIREARGDHEQARVFRGAVEAIRIAEDADRLHEAGLLGPAIRKYEEALTHFLDAYCIQSRLAIQLAAMGKEKEAEAHFRRAYELMPDSFGRMESHCFGCEGVFRGKQAQAIAEQVFTTLIRRTPDKPQLYYLLGYLREAQGRWSEALVQYRHAVALDPDYLNAWVHLEGLGEHLHLSPADRDRYDLAMLRLDPLGRHVPGAGNRVMNLKALWNAAEAVRPMRAPGPRQDLFPLRASAAELVGAESDPQQRAQLAMIRQSMGWRLRLFRGGYGEPPPATPGQQLAQQQVLTALAEILDQSRQSAIPQ